MDKLDLLNESGCALNLQRFTWKDLNAKPISKLYDDAFTRVRVTVKLE